MQPARCDTRKPIPVATLPVSQANRTGERRGSLTVVGFYRYHIRNDGAQESRWVCKCDCGAFTVRSGRSLKRKNMDDMCKFCRDEKQAFAQAFLATNGRLPEYFELPA